MYLPPHTITYVQTLDFQVMTVLRLQPVNYELHREGRRSRVREQQHEHRPAGPDA